MAQELQTYDSFTLADILTEYKLYKGWRLRFHDAVEEERFVKDARNDQKKRAFKVYAVIFVVVCIEFLSSGLYLTKALDNESARIAMGSRIVIILLVLSQAMLLSLGPYVHFDPLFLKTPFFLLGSVLVYVCSEWYTTKALGFSVPDGHNSWSAEVCHTETLLFLALIVEQIAFNFISFVKTAWILPAFQLSLIAVLNVAGLGKYPLAEAFSCFVFIAFISYFLWLGSFYSELCSREDWAEKINLYAKQDRLKATVRLAHLIADKLANYDLDGAEDLLQAEDSASGFHHIGPPLSRLLDNLRCYQAFLPDALFQSKSIQESYSQAPNQILVEAMTGKETSWGYISNAVRHMRHPDYLLKDFHKDVVAGFPELELYTIGEPEMSSGMASEEEYQRTLGAMYSLYCLLRLDIDGKEILSFGVDVDGRPCVAEKDMPLRKTDFYTNMCWEELTALAMKAGLLQVDMEVGLRLQPERATSILTLTAIHDVMKNTALLPIVEQRHGPYEGYAGGEIVGDHDVALAYVLEHFAHVLPSFNGLAPGQRVPIFFSQSKLAFNNGWMVQGEAPPGALLSKFKQVVTNGRASQADINFYFVHWLTDLAGAVPFGNKTWPGAEKLTTKLPLTVLSAFIDSFSYVDRLSSKTEVQVMEEYLDKRFASFAIAPHLVKDGSDIAAMRLALMAQGFEAEVVAAFGNLPVDDRFVLTNEFARTGCNEQFQKTPTYVKSEPFGPAILVYYAPALLQTAGSLQCGLALRILAAVCRAARLLFPLEATKTESTVTIRVSAMKGLIPGRILSMGAWYLKRLSSVDAEVTTEVAPVHNLIQQNASLAIIPITLPLDDCDLAI